MIFFAVAVLIVQLGMAVELFWHGRKIQPLPENGTAPRFPRLSVIVPACNEESTLRPAVESMLAQDYPDYEIVIVNDRSTDGTGGVVAALAAEHPGKIRPVTVEQLPTGWLGKNHALYTGYQHATGDWILFTDADIHFHPSAFRWAVAFGEREGLDHVALTPRLLSQGWLLRAFISFFLFSFWTGVKPYYANDPQRKDRGAGFGSFNLVRREAYERVGTHRALSLRPDDDMMLGMRLKRVGCRQRVCDGARVDVVEWYPTLGAAIRGLEKNMFPFQGYSVGRVFGISVLLTVAMILPYVLVFLAGGAARWALVVTILLQMATFLYANFKSGTKLGDALAGAPLLPLMAGLTLYAFWRSTVKTLRQGGLYWRGTFYPISSLKGQSGLEGLA